MSELDVASPCVRNCCLDERDVCVGCGRTIGEILEWSHAGPERRRAVLDLAKERLVALRLRR